MIDPKLIAALQSNPNFKKELAKSYMKNGNFAEIELKYSLEPGAVDEILEDDDNLMKEFDDTLRSLTQKLLRREGSHKIFKVVKTLFTVLEDTTGVEDGGPTVSDKVKAANALAKLLEPPKEKKGDKEDELDKLLRQALEDE